MWRNQHLRKFLQKQTWVKYTCTCCCPVYFYFSLLFFYILFVMLEIKIKIKAFNPFIVTSRYVKLGLVFLFYFSLFLCFDAGFPISFDVFLSNFNYSIKRCKEKVTQVDKWCFSVVLRLFVIGFQWRSWNTWDWDVTLNPPEVHSTSGLPVKCFTRLSEVNPTPSRLPPSQYTHTQNILMGKIFFEAKNNDCYFVFLVLNSNLWYWMQSSYLNLENWTEYVFNTCM